MAVLADADAPTSVSWEDCRPLLCEWLDNPADIRAAMHWCVAMIAYHGPRSSQPAPLRLHLTPPAMVMHPGEASRIIRKAAEMHQQHTIHRVCRRRESLTRLFIAANLLVHWGVEMSHHQCGGADCASCRNLLKDVDEQ